MSTDPMRDPSHLTQVQYRDTTNLQTRIDFHERFGQNRTNFVRWLFDHVDLPPDARILEVGGGAGAFWVRNADRIPPKWRITLSDLSDGMLAEARQVLDPARYDIQRIDVQAIPFPDGTFDAVLAFHMLFHVPNLDRAFTEIHRVLRPGGHFSASSNGRGHLSELFDLMAAFDPSLARPIPQPFAFEDAPEILAPWFDDVMVHRFENSLVVTEAESLVAFILSGTRYPMFDPARRPELLAFVEARLARDGAIRITNNAGMVVAMRNRFRREDMYDNDGN